MVSHGAPSRSIVAIAEPSSTADALPTPCRRSCQAISESSLPGAIVRLAQPGEIALDDVHGTFTSQLQQRTLEPSEVALAPAGGGNAQPAPVEIDDPAASGRVEQQVVGVEVGVVEAGAVRPGDQATGLFPGRAIARNGGP